MSHSQGGKLVNTNRPTDGPDVGVTRKGLWNNYKIFEEFLEKS